MHSQNYFENNIKPKAKLTNEKKNRQPHQAIENANKFDWKA